MLEHDRALHDSPEHKNILRETWCAQLWASVIREVHVVSDLMCDTRTCWNRQWLSGRRRFGGGVVSGTRAVDHQYIGSKQCRQSLEQWPQKRSLALVDPHFYANTVLSKGLCASEKNQEAAARAP